MRSSVLRIALALAPLLAAACTESASDGAADAGDAGVTCAASGTGTVTVTVSGLPAGLTPEVSLEGAGAASPIVSGETVTVAGGSYRVRAKVIAESGAPIVRTAYAAAIDPPELCLTNGAAQAVTVTYSPAPTSNKLWTTNQNGGAQLLGYASSSLAATGSPAATVATKASPGRSLAFDRDGNAWSPGGTTADATIVRYGAASLAASGDARPDVELRFAPGSGCVPAIASIAFASDGALWATSPCANEALRLAPEDLRASGAPAPGVNLGGLAGPEGLAFDEDGNLWIADAGAKTLRYDAARLGASSSEAASLVVSPKTEASAELTPNHLAFDKDGNLWVASFAANTIYRLTPADLAGAGAKDVRPAIQISLAVSALPEGLAFDESGALWLPLGQGRIGRLGAGQLGASSTPGAPTAPEIVVSSPDIAYANGLAFFPAAKGTPLYAALP